MNTQYAQELRKQEAQRLLAQKKLSLVFDLDHTLLNSSRVIDVAAEDVPQLEEILDRERDEERKSLFYLEHMHTWTKLRPFCYQMLEEASKLFDMHVYTMGERAYALEMVKLLDPDGSLFGDHVVSKVSIRLCKKQQVLFRFLFSSNALCAFHSVTARMIL